MDFLKAEIERKRKLMEEAKVLKTSASSSGPTANKYFKRGELLKKQVGCQFILFNIFGGLSYLSMALNSITLISIIATEFRTYVNEGR